MVPLFKGRAPWQVEKIRVTAASDDIKHGAHR
jgi:hypothetical protein